MYDYTEKIPSKKLIFARLIKKFHASYETQKLVSIFRRDCDYALFWNSLMNPVHIFTLCFVIIYCSIVLLYMRRSTIGLPPFTD